MKLDPEEGVIAAALDTAVCRKGDNVQESGTHPAPCPSLGMRGSDGSLVELLADSVREQNPQPALALGKLDGRSSGLGG